MKTYKLNKKSFNFSFIYKVVVNSFLLTTAFVFSQDCNLKIEGKITDLHTNAPLEAAVVQVLGSGDNTISNANGYFVFNNLCLGKVTIKISHINCDNLVKEIDLVKSDSFEFKLEHRVEDLDEVIVSKLKTDNLSLTNKIYSLSELQKDRFSSKGLADALEQISGVSTLSTGNSIVKPVIHGMFGSRVGIIYDDIFLENQQWGQDHAPNVDLNAFENIRLIKGAGALKYSGSTPGGIVILESVLPKKENSLYGKTKLNGMTNSRGLSLVTNWVKSHENGFYYKLQGTVKRNGDFSAPNYTLTNTGNDEKNVSLIIGKSGNKNNWKFFVSFFDAEIGILRSSHISNVRGLFYSIENQIPEIIKPFSYDINFPKQSNRHYTTSLEYSKTYDQDRKLKIRYSWQKNNRKEYDLRIGTLKYTPSLDLYLNTHNVTSNFEWKNSIANFDSGIFMQIQDNYSNPYTGIKRLIPDYLKTRLGSYFTAKFTTFKDFNFELGLRYEFLNNEVQKYYRNRRWDAKNYEPLLGQYVIDEVLSQKLVKRKLIFNSLAFNTGIKYKISRHYNLGFNYNYSQRPPDIAEMFSDGLHHSLATIEYGDPFLNQETTHKTLVDFEKIDGLLKYNFSPFLIFSKNYIIIEPNGFESTLRGAFPVWEYSAVNAILKGVDVDISYKVSSNMVFSHNTSWVDGKNVDEKLPLINIPPLTVKNQLQFSFPKWKSFFAIIRSKKVFFQSRFPNNNTRTNIYENGMIIDKVVDVSTPPEGYHDLGIDLNWGPYNLFSSKLSLSLNLDNVLNTSYRNYLNRLRYYSDEMGRNVMLQIKIQH